MYKVVLQSSGYGVSISVRFPVRYFIKVNKQILYKINFRTTGLMDFFRKVAIGKLKINGRIPKTMVNYFNPSRIIRGQNPSEVVPPHVIAFRICCKMRVKIGL